MSSRIVPLIAAIASFVIASLFILYFQSMWKWIIASPLLVFVTWPSLKISMFSSKEAIDKMTGIHKE